MSKLVRMLLTIIVTGLFVYVSMGIFKFFDIGFDVYGNYIMWGIALVFV